MSDLAPGILPYDFVGCVGERVMPSATYKCEQKKAGNKASRTPGKTKGETCQTDPIKKFFACSPKAYKHPQYLIWHKSFLAMSKTSGANVQTPTK